MKIGIYFGSFNPPHKAHISIANYVVDNMSLDKLKFVISPQNPFKINYSLCDVEHRISMTILAIEGHDKLEVSDIETKLPTPSYTIDTLKKIIEEDGDDNDYYIVMGFDNFVDIEKWKDYEKIIKLAHIVVLPRLSETVDSLKVCKEIFDKKQNEIIERIVTNKTITLLEDAPISEISSSLIRHKISVGEEISDYVEKGVETYMSDLSLYKTNITISIEAYNALISKIRGLEQSLSESDKKVEELSLAHERLEAVKEFLNDDISFLERMFQWKQILLAINNY